MQLVQLSEYIDTAGSWTPRDALEHLLDKIQSGELDIQRLFVAYQIKGNSTGYIAAGPGDVYSKVGIVHFCVDKYLRDCRE